MFVNHFQVDERDRDVRHFIVGDYAERNFAGYLQLDTVVISMIGVVYGSTDGCYAIDELFLESGFHFTNRFSGS
jgi:hypothetical protein